MPLCMGQTFRLLFTRHYALTFTVCSNFNGRYGNNRSRVCFGIHRCHRCKHYRLHYASPVIYENASIFDCRVSIRKVQSLWTANLWCGCHGCRQHYCNCRCGIQRQLQLYTSSPIESRRKQCCNLSKLHHRRCKVLLYL